MADELNALIPDDEAETYDVRDILGQVFDRDSFLEVHPAYAPNAVVGFARLDGFSVGIVANQPAVMAGVLDIDASDKIARFIRICDVYNIPVITFVDCPGFLPGVDQEYQGVIRHGAKIIYAYCEATVPKISIVTRRAMGGAYVAMSSRQMRTDIAFAWPERPDRGDGRRGRRPDPLRPRGPRRGRPGRGHRRVRPPVPRRLLQPVPRGRRRPDRRGHRAARDPAAPHPGARAAAHEGPAEPAQEARPVPGLTMDNLGFGLQVTVLGLGDRLRAARPAVAAAHDRRPARRARRAAGRVARSRVAARRRSGRSTARTEVRRRSSSRRSPSRSVRHAEQRRRQAAPVMRSYWPGSLLFASRWVAAGRMRQGQTLAPEGPMSLRRYTVSIDDHSFTIDVLETAADRFEVSVDGRTFEATLLDDHDLPGSADLAGGRRRASRVPAAPPLRRRRRPAPSTAAEPAAPRGAGARAGAGRAAGVRRAVGADAGRRPRGLRRGRRERPAR